MGKCWVEMKVVVQVTRLDGMTAAGKGAAWELEWEKNWEEAKEEEWGRRKARV